MTETETDKISRCVSGLADVLDNAPDNRTMLRAVRLACDLRLSPSRFTLEKLERKVASLKRGRFG